MVTRSDIKYIQSLHAVKHRREHRQFLAEGNHLAMEALHYAPQNILKIFALPQWIREQEQLPANQIIIEVSEAEMQRMSSLQTATPVLLLLNMPDDQNLRPPPNQWSICLDSVQDPGNVGSIIRIADWFGISHVFCGEGTADVYNAKTIQASMGSIFRVHVVSGSLPLLLKDSKTIYGATLKGNSVWELGNVKPGALVIGSEGSGISERVQKLVTQAITIPKIGRAESLNAAVATGILCAYLSQP